MYSPKIILAIFFRFAQGFIAFLGISLQNQALTNHDFNTLSLIGNAILLSTFLDFGVSVQFTQIHFENVRIYNYPEYNLALKHLRNSFKVFTLISLLQSLVILIYSFFYLWSNKADFSIEMILLIFIISFIFNMSVFSSRALMALGKVVRSTVYQLFGITVQLIFTTIAYFYSWGVIPFLITLLLPSLIVGLFGLIHIVNGCVDSGIFNLEEIKIRKYLNLRIQSLQILQFLIGTIPILFYAQSVDPIMLSAILVQWRIFTSVTAALSIVNNIDWRNRALSSLDKNAGFTALQNRLNLKLITSFAVSLVTIIGTSFLWPSIFPSLEAPKIADLAVWAFFVVFQVFQWHYYFDFLAIGSYSTLIKMTAIQLCITLLLLNFIEPSTISKFPISYAIALVASTFYLKNQKRV